ncbi:MAG: hypothetical protein ACJAZ2_001930 [Glaciecola sp.]|jgi:hypothetical protein
MISWIKKLTPSSTTLWIMAIVVLVLFNFFKGWKKDSSVFKHDTNQYHSYLVAQFVHNDLTFSFPNPYWLHKSPKDINVNKFTLGVALMEMPFFLIGHAIANTTSHAADGYSPPYSYSATIGIICYVFFGLYLIRKVLLTYFNEFATTLALLSVFLATNLHFYTVTEGPMSHSYLFFLVSVIVYTSMKWHHSKKIKYLYTAIFFCGFATVLRPTNLLCLLIPVLYGASNIKETWVKIKTLINFKTIIFGIGFFILATLPQIIYWKWATGSLIYYSYSEEGFFFNDPKILSFLFSFTKGWLLYTPVMLLPFLGFFSPQVKHLRVLFAIFMTIIIYVLSSWWCWWYGGSYGMRSMVEYYPLLTIPLAALFHTLSASKAKKMISISLVALFISWNIISEVKYKNIVIYWDGMTYETYKYTFFKIQLSKEERLFFESRLRFIDPKDALKGIRDQYKPR